MGYFIGAVCFWLAVFFPFALWARHITRQDGLSTTEAYILGQACGPVGVWLVMRQNKIAAATAYRAGLLVDHIREAPPAPKGETPEQMERRLQGEPPPLLNAGAYRAQHDVKPVVKQTRLDTVNLHDRVRPGPQPRVEAPPHEPPPPPPTKAAIAWQPPPADYEFTHSDENRLSPRPVAVPSTVDTLPKTEAAMAEHVQNFIGGKWAEASGEKLDSRDPGNGDLIAEFKQATNEDVDKAVAAAKAAFPAWKATPAPKRAEVILRSADVLLKRKEEISQLMSREMGKPIAEARGDVQEAVDMAFYIAAEGRRGWGHTIPAEMPNKRMYTIRQPLGVCSLITPWNFPIAIPSWKTYPALIMGNTVVFKPAEDTTLLGKRWAEVLVESGVPAGVFNMVIGHGAPIGDKLVTHPDVRMISFTGSTRTGLGIAAKAAPLNKRVSLEMGGKNPVIVWEDGDLELAVNAVMWAGYGTSGQRCTACSRVIVHEAVHDKFLKMLVERAPKLKVGHGADPDSFFGAIINAGQLKKIDDYVQIGIKEGAKLECGGKVLKDGAFAKGNYYAATVFSGVKPGMRIEQEEIFGPVISVLKVKTYDEAIKIANDTQYGLSAGFISNDVNLCHRASIDLDCGLCYINAGSTGAEVSTPFGGWKNTGNGHREGGPTVIDAFSELKTVVIDYSGKVQKAQIDNN